MQKVNQCSGSYQAHFGTAMSSLRWFCTVGAPRSQMMQNEQSIGLAYLTNLLDCPIFTRFQVSGSGFGQDFSDFGSLERQMFFFKNAVIIIRLKQWQYSYIDYNRTENDAGQFNILSQVREVGTGVIPRSYSQIHFSE